MLKSKKIGKNQIFENWKKINQFVSENWGTLYEGAERLDLQIPSDYYAPQRIQINNTRLHSGQLANKYYPESHKDSDIYEHKTGYVKIADGWHFEKDPKSALTDAKLKQTIKDVQLLIDEAAKEIETNVTVSFT